LERNEDDVHVLAPLGRGDKEHDDDAVEDADDDTEDEVEADDDCTIARFS
jgi:hypothetical protein